MPTLEPLSGGEPFIPSIGTSEIDSVRELNRLLESALRMGGGGGGGVGGNGSGSGSGNGNGSGNSNGNDDTTTTNSTAGFTTNAQGTPSYSFGTMSVADDNPDGGNNRFSNSEQAASWRLDTARRLSSLLSSQNPNNPDNQHISDNDNNTSTSNNTNNNNNNTNTNNLLLPALRRQSRYWIPLLLSWLKGSGNTEPSENFNDSSLDLPLTNKQRRQREQRQRNNSAPEVQIEALRALTALTEWTSRSRELEDQSHQSNNSNINNNNNNTVDNQQNNNNPPALYITAGCSPHTPLSTSSQRLLLRHADAVPMIVSLLSSPDACVHEQAMWILGSIASSGLGGASLPTAAAAEMTKMMARERDNISEGGMDGSAASVALPASTASELTAGRTKEHHTPLSSGGSLMMGEGDNQDGTAHPANKETTTRSKKDVSARDVIFAARAMGPLLKCLGDNPQNVHLHRVGAWCLSSLVEGRYSSSSSSSSSSGDKDSGSSSMRKQSPLAAEEIDVLTLLPTLKRMLHMDDAEALTFTCWTLSHLCDGPAYHIAAVIYSETSMASKRRMSPANGLVPRLVELLLHPSPKVAKPALRTVGNIVCADCTDQTDQYGNNLPVVDFTEIILECHAVPCLRRLVGHHNREIQKEACWTLSNIAAGTASQIQAVIDSGAIPPLVDLVNNELTDKEVRSEACWVVLNATSCGNDEQISILIEEGCVSVLGVLLTEPNMVMMALEGIERVLQTEEAQDSEDLYHKSEEELGQRPTIIRCASLIKTVTESPHNSSAVSKRAKRIWEHHFISCALCHNNYSRCRLRDSHFCNECKCHVCSSCDCRVYHLSYQEELWAEDEEKAEASKKSKKSKKAKKKQKAKEKAEKKKKAEQTVQQQEPQVKADTPAKKGSTEVAANEGKGPAASKTTHAKNEPSTIAKAVDSPSPEKKGKKKGSKNKKGGVAATRDTKSSSPSRGTIESDAADSLLDSGHGNAAAENDNGNINSDGESSEANSGNGQPPIDLVSYLQQTGSIIALAKLLDSLYDDEYDEEGEPLQRNIDLNHRVWTTQ